MALTTLRVALVSSALLAVGVAGLGVSAAATPSGSQPAPSAANTAQHAVKPAFQTPGHVSEMSYVPVAPCTLVDTRRAGGALTGAVSRSYNARGTGSLAGQGGNAAGCAIPTNAAVIATSVSAVTPTRSGFIQTNAFDGTGPGTTVVNYFKGQSITGFTDIDLAQPGSAKAFKVKNNVGSTQLVVTVVGYYIAPLGAEVESTGALLDGSRVTLAEQIPGFPNNYEVDFDRDVSKCHYSATSTSSNLIADVEPRSGNADGVFVLFRNGAGAATATRFYLIVSC